MPTHPHVAIPGAIRGRPKLLPRTMADETCTLISAGFTVLEVAEHFGVSRSTMYRQRDIAAEFVQSLKEGRAAYRALERDLAALQRAEEADHRRAAAQEMAELIHQVLAPTTVAINPTAPPVSPMTSAPIPEEYPVPDGTDAAGIALPTPFHEYEGPGAPLPLDDPLAGW